MRCVLRVICSKYTNELLFLHQRDNHFNQMIRTLRCDNDTNMCFWLHTRAFLRRVFHPTNVEHTEG